MDLIETPQDFTASWVNLGGQIRMEDFARLGAYLKIDINDTTDARIRAVCKTHRNDDTEYVLPIRNVTASAVQIEDEYIEFTDDADQNVVLEVETKGLVPYIQLQIEAGDPGATEGQITKATVIQSNY